MTKTLRRARPRLILPQTDSDRLSSLALRVPEPTSPAAKLLLEEIERAEVRPDDKIPADVVRMYSTVEFVDEAHGQARTVELVYPGEADIAAGRISVLTPIGAGLIGLRAGQEIAWPDRDGHVRRLRILKVLPPAQAAT